MVDFCNRLKQLRVSKGISQAKFAKLIHTTRSSVSAYENSSRLPSYEILIRIALYFNVSTDFLLGLSERQFLDTTSLTQNQLEIISTLINEFKSNI